jgi:hypothetical protein
VALERFHAWHAVANDRMSRKASRILAVRRVTFGVKRFRQMTLPRVSLHSVVLSTPPPTDAPAPAHKGKLYS